MVTIKRDTIIKPGDVIVSTGGQERWKVKEMVGMKIYVVHPVSNQQRIMLKNDLLIHDWKLEVNNRGYW